MGFWLSAPGCGILAVESRCEILAVGSSLSAPGCQLLAVGSWLWDLGCGILIVGSWLWDHGCGILAVGSWLSAPGSGILALGSWLRDPGGEALGTKNIEKHCVFNVFWVAHRANITKTLCFIRFLSLWSQKTLCFIISVRCAQIPPPCFLFRWWQTSGGNSKIKQK